jgi:hypothetical protein
MSIHSRLLVCLSIPSLTNLNTSVQQAAAIKGTTEEKEAYHGVSVDGKTIIREIKPSFNEPDKRQRTYHFMVPKAQTKLPDKIPTSPKDVSKYNETVRNQRRTSTVAGAASAVPTYSITNDALTEIKSVMSSIVTSSSFLNSPLESTEATKLTVSETSS